jgi:MoaA/NifB/PqqE/SkfB family radical SAM enzyme
MDKKLLVSLNNTCQLRCRFCVYRHRKHSRILAIDDWKSMMGQAYSLGYKTLEIGGQGEPTLYPAFSEVVLTAHKIGFRVELLTNAVDIASLRGIVPLLGLITINLNAINQKEYDAVHDPAKSVDVESVLQNIAILLQAVDTKKARIKIDHLVTKDNIIRCLQFPYLLNETLKKYAPASNLPIFVNYKHLLVTPFNHLQMPHPRRLQLSKKIYARFARQRFYREATNLNDFIKKTDDMIPYLEALWPFNKDTRKSYIKKVMREKLDKKFACQYFKTHLFIDCNGDAFGCVNPSRVVHRLIPYEDEPYYLGNVLNESSQAIFKKSKKICFSADWGKKIWKPCLTCC